MQPDVYYATYLPLAYAHLATILPAFVIGTYMMIRRKGTPLHRLLGKIYMVLMLVTAVITLFIAAVLGIWALFAFSAAGTVRRLPLTRTALVAISTVLMLRAIMGLFGAMWRPDLSGTFMLISSLIVLALGLCFAIGTWRAWPHLSHKDARV